MLKGTYRENIVRPDDAFGALDRPTIFGDGIEHDAGQLSYGLGNTDAVAAALFATTHNACAIATKVAYL